jgi:photoactive yellow protein
MSMQPLPPPPTVTPRPRASRTTTTVGPSHVDDLDDASLDELPFGVVCLASDGLILRYNVAEGRLARLDPSTVVGRNFFTDVAPCTYTEEFYGRFRAFADGKTSGASLRFAYVFDFKFGAQNVEIELVRAADAPRFYLLINRMQFLPERTGPDAREPAPRQRELVPGEAERGVLRNEFAERIVAAPASLFEMLSTTLDKHAPALRHTIGHAWGLAAGRRLVIELETAGVDDVPLRERPMNDTVAFVSGVLRDHGWGMVSFDLGDASRGVLRIEVESSPLVARTTKDGRCCHVLAGMLEAVLNHLAGRRLHVEELRCAASTGHPCEMIVVGDSRRARVMELAEKGCSFEDAIAALEGGHDDASGH